MKGLTNKRLLVTGGANGIGRATALRFLEEGCKAGVVELSRTMARELAPVVRVLSISPGAVLTATQEAEYSDEMFAELDGEIRLGCHAQTEEIAALFAFLAIDEAPSLHGTSVIVDGGETAGELASQCRPIV